MKKLTFLIFLLSVGPLASAHDHLVPHMHPGEAYPVWTIAFVILSAGLLWAAVRGIRYFRKG